MTLQHFLRQYISAIHSGDAALFIGAGMSKPLGFLDWRSLLQECADELQLDLGRENDLVALAQYYLNHKGGERGSLNSILRKEFDRHVALSPNHEILARLPIRTVWTTNYDTVLERAYEQGRRTVDVKRRDQDIPVAQHHRDVRLYKMHGDISDPSQIVVSKQDYERYPVKHRVFQGALETDLLSKTFLFLGFSFSDPNLAYILGHLRSILEYDKREHYAVLRQARLDWHTDQNHAQSRLSYEERRQALLIRDLQRYGIEVILVERFSEITALLGEIERRCKERCVFVSGSAHQYGAMSEDRMRDFCMRLGERLMRNGYQLISGLGLNVGDCVLKGALLELFHSGKSPTEEHLVLRPFPRELPASVSSQEFNGVYRSDLVTQCGVAIFVAGTSRSSNVSRGVIEEFELARRMGKIIIPVGASGFAAKSIWQMLEPDIQNAYGGVVDSRLFARLNDPGQENDAIIDCIFEIMTRTGRMAA